MKKLSLLSTLLLCYGLTFSQSTNISTLLHSNVKKGDQFYEQFAYRNALEIYMHAHEKDPGNYYLRERIGQCYFKLHDPASAEIWFSSLAKETDIHPEIKFEYAEALSMTGNYQESKFWFEKYLAERPDDKIAKDKFDFLKNLDKYISDPNRYILSPVDFNTDHSEYGAHFFHEGVVFASSRDLDLFIKHKPFDALYPHEALLNLYYAARKTTGEWEPSVSFHTEHLKTFYHEGPMAFYDNYRKGAYTQSNLKDGKPVYDVNGKVNLRIYFAEVAHLGEFAHVAPFEYNNDGYSTAHPSFSVDGKKMYFSSTNPTGLGESDIYYSAFENGRWTEPVNVGPNINTREDQSFPYITNDSTLYFSSNGHGTLGGLDIYVSYKRNGVFGKAINLGSPVNTMYDDFSLVADSTGRVGFIASNRPGGKGIDDIYFYIANYYFLAGQVHELGKNSKIPDATILAYNGNGELVDSTKSDADGYFNLLLPFDQDFKIRGEKDGYETLDDLAFSTKGKPFGVDSLLLPMWKQNLFVKGKVISRETNAILPGTLVTLRDLKSGEVDTVTLNDKGEYVFLLRPDKSYRIEASKEGHVTKGLDFDTNGLRDGEIRKDIVLDEMYVERETLYFAYNKMNLTPESKTRMDGIIRTLKATADATLTIEAHADCRGKSTYNLGLSGRRGNAAMQYVISKGIKRSRVSSKGYGESTPVNKCVDGVDCTEDEHSLNRRAEMKIQYKIPAKN